VDGRNAGEGDVRNWKELRLIHLVPLETTKGREP
jgi:hypothetical protein